jgi:L,D-peptidoglycan transpeptidase YkuD (ErfK/YbiS/YcfS/YnhG family)
MLAGLTLMAGCTSAVPSAIGSGGTGAPGSTTSASSIPATPAPASAPSTSRSRTAPSSTVIKRTPTRTPTTSVPPKAPAPKPSAVPPTTTRRSTAPPAAPMQLPLGYRGSAAQVITVAAGSAGATSATLTAWQRSGTGWKAVVGPVFAWVGYAGTGATREGMSRTPAGTYPLTHAFGSLGNPGTRMPYFRSGPNDWWDENAASATYNRHVVRATSPGGASENLYYSGPAYGYAVNIDYNTNPVLPGAGSAFFLHVTEGHPTQGCVSVPSNSLVAILRWLDPTQHPVIVLGVG